MQGIKIKYILLLAVLALAAKPFVGFALYNSILNGPESSILVKAFSKRKQEFVKNSDYDMEAVQKRLSQPDNLFLVTFAFLLSLLFPFVFSAVKRVTHNSLVTLRLNVLQPQPRYILGGTLLI
jgi:hypothetical protein